MKIARIGKFVLRTITNIDPNRVITNHDLEIVVYFELDRCYTIAFINENGELESVADRLLANINDTEDIEALKILEQIARLIINDTDALTS